MKKPKLSNLKIDWDQTKKIREMAAQATKVKVTFNLDSDLLIKLKSIAKERSSKYQTLLNNLLREVLSRKNTFEDRFKKLEKEVGLLKHKATHNT